jgi:hypothetical protein
MQCPFGLSFGRCPLRLNHCYDRVGSVLRKRQFFGCKSFRRCGKRIRAGGGALSNERPYRDRMRQRGDALR